jgi:hypothetical protein
MICKSLPNSIKGGIQTHVWELSGQLIAAGVEISILTSGSVKQGLRWYKSSAHASSVSFSNSNFSFFPALIPQKMANAERGKSRDQGIPSPNMIYKPCGV